MTQNTHLDSAHSTAAVTPDSAGSCGSVRGAPPECSAVCNYDRSNCTCTASLQLETTLGTKKENDIITTNMSAISILKVESDMNVGFTSLLTLPLIR